jgi:glutathione S-transferase
MKLFYARPSPFVRKVMVVLEEAGKTGEVELVEGFGSPTAPNEAVVKSNPIGKIPCLVLDSGQTVYDSRVITRYLDARFGTGLYPAGEDLWSTLTLEAHADGILDAAVLSVYEIRCRSEDIRSAEWVAGQHAKIKRGLDALESDWLGQLAGPLDIGHIGVGCVLGYLDFRIEMGGWPDWRSGRPGLASWGGAFLERASMKATAPE